MKTQLETCKACGARVIDMASHWITAGHIVRPAIQAVAIEDMRRDAKAAR